MAFASCKAAQNAQALVAVDGCTRQMSALEFIMASAEWDRLPVDLRHDFVDEAIRADKELEECCKRFCKDYEHLLAQIEKAVLKNEAE